jgi:hypothetical protein
MLMGWSRQLDQVANTVIEAKKTMVLMPRNS